MIIKRVGCLDNRSSESISDRIDVVLTELTWSNTNKKDGNTIKGAFYNDFKLFIVLKLARFYF